MQPARSLPEHSNPAAPNLVQPKPPHSPLLPKPPPLPQCADVYAGTPPVSCVALFATAPVWATWPADREPVRLRYRQTKSVLVENRPSAERRVDCHAASSPPPNADVVRLTSAVDELVRRLAPKDEGDLDGVPASPAATPHRQDHSCFRTDTKPDEIVQRLADGRDRSPHIRISKASRQQHHAFALLRRLFGGHSIGSSI